MVDQPYEHCCGCSACATICPNKAIVMEEKTYGFIYPTVQSARCIECGLCEKICPEINFPILHAPTAVYAAYSSLRDELNSCASGGAATVFGKEIIHRGGVVYGCSQKNYRLIRHIRVTCENDLELLKGSKYVHSDTYGIYADVRKDLISGRPVLFVGTPCQVGALKCYLQKPFENLLTIDLICHGVPSQAMLRQMVEHEFSQNQVALENIFVNFRWKTLYGIQFGIQFGIDGEIIKSIPGDKSAYMTAFLRGLSYRENCYNCHYSCNERVADITIGDFWGLGREVSTSLDIKRGVSLVMVNTAHGAEIWEKVKQSFISETRTLAEAVKYNWNLHDPSPRPAFKDRFLNLYRLRGLEYAVDSCLRKSIVKKQFTAFLKKTKNIISGMIHKSGNNKKD